MTKMARLRGPSAVLIPLYQGAIRTHESMGVAAFAMHMAVRQFFG